MAEGRGAPLTNRQIQRLAASISRHDMESIAMGYLNISHEKIKSCRGEETEAFNREMIVLWANRNPKDQVMSLARLLFQAASDGYMNPFKVVDILEVTEDEVVPPYVPSVPMLPQMSKEFSKSLQKSCSQTSVNTGIKGSRRRRTLSIRDMIFRDLKLETLAKDLLETLVHIVRILCGFPCTIKPHHSRVVVHVPGGSHGVILGNVYENLHKEKTLLQKSDYIVSPMCEFEFHGYLNIPKGAWIKIQVPHILKNPTVHSKVTVMSRDRNQDSIEYAQRLGQEEEPPDNRHIYYRLFEETIEIFTQHFCQFIAYAKNSTSDEVMGMNALQCCGRVAELLVFTKWIARGLRKPLLEVVLYMCCLHYEGKNYIKEIESKMENEGRTMLGCKGFFLGDEPYDPSERSVEVRILTRDNGGEVWSGTKYSPLHSSWKLDEIFTLEEGHICRSAPKPLRTFYLVPRSATYRLHMELSVFVKGKHQVYGFEGSVGDPPLPGQSTLTLEAPPVTIQEKKPPSRSSSFPNDLSSGLECDGEPWKTPEAQELTDEKLIKLAFLIPKKGDLCVLAVNLGIYLHISERQITHEKDITEASYNTIKLWYDQQPDRTSAYKSMYQALQDANMAWLIREIE